MATEKKYIRQNTEDNNAGLCGAWIFKLYIAGKTPQAMFAEKNLRKFCDKHIGGEYYIEIIDLFTHPQRAGDDRIIAVPAITSSRPGTVKHIIGDFGNEELMLMRTGLLPDDSVE